MWKWCVLNVFFYRLVYFSSLLLNRVMTTVGSRVMRPITKADTIRSVTRWITVTTGNVCRGRIREDLVEAASMTITVVMVIYFSGVWEILEMIDSGLFQRNAGALKVPPIRILISCSWATFRTLLLKTTSAISSRTLERFRTCASTTSRAWRAECRAGNERHPTTASLLSSRRRACRTVSQLRWGDEIQTLILEVIFANIHSPSTTQVTIRTGPRWMWKRRKSRTDRVTQWVAEGAGWAWTARWVPVRGITGSVEVAEEWAGPAGCRGAARPWAATGGLTVSTERRKIAGRTTARTTVASRAGVRFPFNRLLVCAA